MMLYLNFPKRKKRDWLSLVGDSILQIVLSRHWHNLRTIKSSTNTLEMLYNEAIITSPELSDINNRGKKTVNYMLSAASWNPDEKI